MSPLLHSLKANSLILQIRIPEIMHEHFWHVRELNNSRKLQNTCFLVRKRTPRHTADAMTFASNPQLMIRAIVIFAVRIVFIL